MMFNKVSFVIAVCAISTIVVRGQIGSCGRRFRYDCLPGTNDKSNCPPQCNACPANFPLPRLCQTAHRACILEERHVLSQYTTKVSCEAGPGRAWCGGDSVQECVEMQPIREECFKRIINLEACSNHTDIRSCHDHRCFWCDVGAVSTDDTCFKIDPSISRCDNDTCCYKDTCLAGNFTDAECSVRSCTTCNDGTRDRCNFAGERETRPVEQNKWSKCSRKCGGGTQYRLVNCTNIFNETKCEQEWRSCNKHDCMLPLGSCDAGMRTRYNDDTLCCANNTKVCGWNTLNGRDVNHRRKRVVGGIDVTDAYRWPWLAIAYIDISNGPLARACPATLISDDILVASYECMGNGTLINRNDTEVHFGNPNRDLRPKHLSKINQINTYIEYGINAFNIDPEFPDESLFPPLCWPNGEEPLLDRRCIVAGWGRSDANSNSSCTSILQEANVRVLPWALCEEAWDLQSPGPNGEEYICAGIPEGEVDACVGDNGAPLMCQRCENCAWYWAGMVTSFIGCGQSGKPSVYLKTMGTIENVLIDDNITNVFGNSQRFSSCRPHHYNIYT